MSSVDRRRAKTHAPLTLRETPKCIAPVQEARAQEESHRTQSFGRRENSSRHTRVMFVVSIIATSPRRWRHAQCRVVCADWSARRARCASSPLPTRCCRHRAARAATAFPLVMYVRANNNYIHIILHRTNAHRYVRALRRCVTGERGGDDDIDGDVPEPARCSSRHARHMLRVTVTALDAGAFADRLPRTVTRARAGRSPH